MELNALKSTLKEMSIKYEKFHTRNSKTSTFAPKKTVPKNYKDKPTNNKIG